MQLYIVCSLSFIKRLNGGQIFYPNFIVCLCRFWVVKNIVVNTLHIKQTGQRDIIVFDEG